MKNPAAYQIPPKLIRRYGTRDPFRICFEKGIEVMFRDDFTTAFTSASAFFILPIISVHDKTPCK